MNDFFNKSKQEYHQINMPDKFHERYIEEIQAVKPRNQLRLLFQLALKLSLVCFLIFTAGINISPVFAKNVYNIPVIGNLAKFVTFREYHFESVGTTTTVKYPHIDGIEDKEVEKKINTLIDKTIHQFLEDQKEYDEIYKDSPIGPKVASDITYQIYFVDENMVSFCLENTQIIASSFIYKKFYTIDLKTGEVYSIKHFLGDNFASIVKEQVYQQASTKMTQDDNYQYFMEDIENLTITENQSFYINKKGQVVISFEKYQVAPGYMGTPEFIIS